MDLKKTPHQKPGYHLESMDNELLLYHPEQTKILYFNETASIVWQLCDGQRTLEEIITLLSKAFPEAAGPLTQDIKTTVQTFLKEEVIELT